LRSLDDRQLRDMGLDRGQIGAALRRRSLRRKMRRTPT
jgi:uncharacterized protein YjiS (DUF1127 family)